MSRTYLDAINDGERPGLRTGESPAAGVVAGLSNARQGPRPWRPAGAYGDGSIVPLLVVLESACRVIDWM